MDVSQFPVCFAKVAPVPDFPGHLVMPSYRPCMANNSAGTKLGAASRVQNPNLKTGVIHGGRSPSTYAMALAGLACGGYSLAFHRFANRRLA
jgi:hypothetical protein